jgi:uncharacterized membrane protein YfcA
VAIEGFVLLTVAGLLAGVINSVVGSGSLVTFPTLLALGFPPVVANITNNIGVLPANIAGAFSYRKYFSGEWGKLALIAVVSAVGGLAGALLLLRLPADTFRMIVPALIVLALALVIFGPMIKAWALARSADPDRPRSERSPLLLAIVGVTGVYGGYFGAAQGVILLSTFSLALNGGLQRANAYKNAVTAAGNIAAVAVFIAIGHVAWDAAAVLAVSSFVGGLIGGKHGQKLPENAYRFIIVAVGICALVYFLIS